VILRPRRRGIDDGNMSGRAKSNKKTTITFAIDDRFLEIIRDDANSHNTAIVLLHYIIQNNDYVVS
jgi:hypothetical protein